MLSRVADSLYWMSRYLERAEHTARILDVQMNTMLELATNNTVEERRARLIKGLGITHPFEPEASEEDLIELLTFDIDIPVSINSCITSARENARQVREQVSSEMWTQINRLYLDARTPTFRSTWEDRPHAFYTAIKEGSHLFQGITDATMNHNQGWYFIQLGRYVERTIGLVNLLDANLTNMAWGDIVQYNEAYFDLVALLKSVTAFEAYCKVYNPNVRPDWIVQFLLYDAHFPRSTRFCVEQMVQALNELADVTMRHKNLRVNRLAGRLQSMLSYDDFSDIINGDFHTYLQSIKEHAYQIHASLFDAYITYPIESALR